MNSFKNFFADSRVTFTVSCCCEQVTGPGHHHPSCVHSQLSSALESSGWSR